MRPALLAALAILGALALAACSAGTPEATPTAAAPTATATPEVTRTPPPARTATATPEPTLHDLAPPAGRILHRCDDTWCVSGLDGSVRTPLTGLPPNTTALTASPTEELIAYYEHAEGTRWLGIVRLDGSNARRLAEARPVHDPVAPVWSPDGSTIYVERGPPPGTDGIGGDTDILAVDVASGVVRVVVDTPEFDGGPQVSPDGSTLVFIHESPEAGGGIGIRTVPTAGGDAIDLTGDPTINTSPSWLLDGRIAFVGFRSGARGSYDIYVMQADGSEVTDISKSQADDIVLPVGHHALAISPDGEWIAFEADRDGTLELYIVRPDGSELRQISRRTGASASLPVWSPDSRFLAYSAVIDDRDGLWITRIEDAATAYAGPAGLMHWQPTVGPTPRPAVARSGAWLIDVADGDATLLTEGYQGDWVSTASFDANGLPVLEIWDDDGQLTARFDLDGELIEAGRPGLGCRPLDDGGGIVIGVPGLEEPREFEGLTCGPRSPDGRLMVYRVDADPIEVTTTYSVPSWDQWLIDLVSGERTLLREAMRHCGGCDGRYVERWSPSGDYVVLPEWLSGGNVYLARSTDGSSRSIGLDRAATDLGRGPVWAPNADRLAYPAADHRTVYEDLGAGVRLEIADLPWPAAFDPSGRYLYSPAWATGDAAVIPETVVFDTVMRSVVATHAGSAAPGNLWGGTGIAVAGQGLHGAGGFATALEFAPDCRGTTVTVVADARPAAGRAIEAPDCIENAWVATFSPDGTQLALARHAREGGAAPGSPWVSSRFDLVIYDVGTGVTRTVARELYTSTTPSFTWNDAGTHLLFRWPAIQGL